MRVVIYDRVSTDDKDQNPERQLLKNQQYCELHNHKVVAVVTDYCSGDSDPLTRKEGSKIMLYKPDGIVFFSMDRFTRQHPTKVIRMIDTMKNQGIKLISITEPAFNMESEFSEILLFIMTWFNNYFLKKLRVDIKSGMEQAVKNGKIIGRPKTEFNKFRAYELLFVKKLSQRTVSKELDVSLATINRFKRGAEKNPSSYINN